MIRHRNNIGFLRLLFASLVIIGHAPEMIDGNRSREPLTQLLHSMSLGEISVDSFFLLSGFLITGSMLSLQAAGPYLSHRVVRIYPAFSIAYLSVLMLVPLTGGDLWWHAGGTVWRLLTLQPPHTFPGQLEGLRFYPLLNGAMWTIAYEFRCYLLVLVFWSAGLLQSRRTILALTILSLLSLVAITYGSGSALINKFSYRGIEFIVGNLGSAIRLGALFMVGICFRMWQDVVLPRLTGSVAASVAALCLLGMYRDPHFAEASFAVFGSGVLFWLAFNARLGIIQRINDKWDISYGVYLYGWPVATFLRWHNPIMSPWWLASLTLPIAMVAGLISWVTIEKPCKRLMANSRHGSQQPVFNSG